MTGTLRATARTLKLAGLFVGASWELAVQRPRTRQARAEWLHRFCARAVRRMKIPVTTHGDFPTRGALITNHRSYLDIPVLASIHPCVFVSKIEMTRMPVLGWMTTMAGTVFVERGRGGSALRAGKAMQEATDEGMTVVFFPEGTTNTQPELLPFHSGLIGQALLEGVELTAGHVRYTLTRPNAPGTTVARDICWGDTPLFVHIFRLLALHGIAAEVHFAPAPIRFSADSLHRKSAAAEARTAVRALSLESAVAPETPEEASETLLPT